MLWFFMDRLGIFVGFAAFFIMEKTMRVLGASDAGHSHSHSQGHGHNHSHAQGAPEPMDAHASGVSTAPPADGLKGRKAQKNASALEEEDHATPDPAPSAAAAAGPQTSKLSAYLNLFGDFVHNM